MKFTADQLKKWDFDSKHKGVWKPARPYVHNTFKARKARIKQAWGVLIGKYDAIDWEGH